jgi:hypothetical protein
MFTRKLSQRPLGKRFLRSYHLAYGVYGVYFCIDTKGRFNEIELYENIKNNKKDAYHRNNQGEHQ